MRALAVLLLAAQGAGLVPAGEAGAAAAARLDALFTALAGAKSPGLAVLVRRQGRTVYERGFGAAELRTYRPIGAGTNFRLASCSKQFTAMAAMLLAHEHKLRYDDPLTSIIKDFPAYGRAITIRDLLHHTSGLPDYEELMQRAGGAGWTESHQITDDEVLRLLESQSRGKFAAGTSWAYSNSGYVLLGVVVSRVSGMPFHEFLRRRLFEPLGMSNTVVLVKGVNEAPQRAYGHGKEGERFVEKDQSATSATLGDGGVYSNLADLAQWDDALRRGTLLSADEMGAALVPARLAGGGATRWPEEAGEDNLAPGKPVSYGFGWFLDPYRGAARMYHTGSTMGFRTAIERFTQSQVTVVVLCNRMDLDAEKLAVAAAGIVSGE